MNTPLSRSMIALILITCVILTACGGSATQAPAARAPAAVKATATRAAQAPKAVQTTAPVAKEKVVEKVVVITITAAPAAAPLPAPPTEAASPTVIITTPTPWVAASPTPSPEPTPTSTPVGCVDGMALVKDLTYADNGMLAPPVLPPGQPFVKGWRVHNTGTCTWDADYALTYVGGNLPLARMGGEAVAVMPTVAGSAEYDFFAELVAPEAPGIYQGFWQMRDSKGVAFGERIWVGIEVRALVTPSPTPRQIPPVGGFTVDRTHVRPGECARFAWNVEDVREVYFYAQGESWEQHPAIGQEVREVCPAKTVVYELRTVLTDGSPETWSLSVVVGPEKGIPITVGLATDPADAVQVDECLRLTWEVYGDTDSVQVLRDETVLWDNAPQAGSIQDCPSEEGMAVYGVIATGLGRTVETKWAVRVNP